MGLKKFRHFDDDLCSIPFMESDRYHGGHDTHNLYCPTFTFYFTKTVLPRKAISPDIPTGDLGQTYDSNKTVTHYELNPTQGKAVLFVGDLSYADQYPNHDNIRWDTWGRFVERNAAYQPWIWSAGNHEIDFIPTLEHPVFCSTNLDELVDLMSILKSPADSVAFSNRLSCLRIMLVSVLKE